MVRSSLTTMDKCKAVSKEVRDLIHDTWFVRNYYRTTKNILGYFVQTIQNHSSVSTFVSVDDDDDDESPLRAPRVSMSSFVKDDMKILASSSQGLLCCRRYESGTYRYYICKPSTGQIVLLPSPMKRLGSFHEHVSLVVVKSNPLHYRIIRYYPDRHLSPSRYDSYVCEIFDSKIWTWRPAENLVTEYNTIFENQPSVCIGEAAYLLTNKDTVVAFDSSRETHAEFGIPEPARGEGNGCSVRQIVEHNGKLGLTSRERNSDRLFLWVLEDGKRCRWREEREVEIHEDEGRLVGCGLADTALMVGYELQVYRQSGFCYPFKPITAIFPFRSDWEAVNLEGEEGCMLSSLEEMMMC
ncbi:unnamed protein product [Cuscuta campestris]|uniref:F-box associated beta-propeller type 3 domain-containing protein n=1 Tax=Cuscuta campestris TaxID=132261 RepID=A0A484LYG8_9ASTE|nr:unnamed protein product [Cuscuta campestris]